MKRKTVPLFFPVLILAGFFACNSPQTSGEDPQTWDTARPLYEIYKSNFLMGNIISPGDINNETRFGYLKRHYNTVTAENHMKPNYIAPDSRGGAYKYTEADRIVNAANDAGLKVHGHTLVWHSQSPKWLTTGGKEAALDNLTKYVTDVTAHFKNKVISWDVVNEAIRDGLGESDTANWKSCLRNNVSNAEINWNSAIGSEYIEQAFLAARAADPAAKLFYNDYNLNNANKAKAVYNMVKDINSRYPGVNGRPLIDGIGMQSHHHLYTDPNTVDKSIALFASLGVEIAVSEMDIQAAGNLAGNSVTWGEDAESRQADVYAAMFRIFKKYDSSITRVTFWGIDDTTSWRAQTHPTLIDNNKDYRLKKAFYAISNP